MVARRFAPQFGATLATILGLAVLLGLGTWQLQRLAWKQALIADREANLQAPPMALPDAAAWPELEFRHVRVTGRFRHDREQRFGVQAIAGQVGHHILTPLIAEDGRAVLVDRGWVPADKVTPATRRAGQVEGTTTVTGIARYREDDRPGWFTPANQPAESIWYSYDLPALRAATGLDLSPVVIEADAGDDPQVLPRGGQTQVDLPNNHLQYAITWYGLAGGLLAVYIAFSRRSRIPPAPRNPRA